MYPLKWILVLNVFSWIIFVDGSRGSCFNTSLVKKPFNFFDRIVGGPYKFKETVFVSSPTHLSDQYIKECTSVGLNIDDDGKLRWKSGKHNLFANVDREWANRYDFYGDSSLSDYFVTITFFDTDDTEDVDPLYVKWGYAVGALCTLDQDDIWLLDLNVKDCADVDRVIDLLHADQVFKTYEKHFVEEKMIESFKNCFNCLERNNTTFK